MFLKKGIFYLCLMYFIPLAVFAQATATQTLFPEKLTLNNQEWKLGFHDENKDVLLGEYVTNGETVNDWTQLVTFQKFKFVFNKSVTPAKFAEKEVEPIKNDPKYQLYFNIIESNAKEALMEFRISMPKSEQQDELQRIIRTSDNKLIVLHYVIAKADMGQEARDNWIKALKNIDVTFLTNDEDDLR